LEKEMSILQKVKVGKTGLEVPQLGLGTGFLARPSALIAEETALEMVRFAHSKGVNFFDTAPFYGSGNAEKRLGKALAGIPRDSFILETKVGRLVQPDGSIVFDYSKEGLQRSLEESLKRLKMDRIDIALMHDPDAYFKDYRAALAAFEVLADWRSQGLVRAIGAGLNHCEWPTRFTEIAEVDCFLLAGRYTLLEQKEALGFLALCREKGISIFSGGIFNTGILATGPIPGASYEYREASEPVKERVRRIEAVCARHKVALSVAALQFPLHNPAVTSMVVGAKSSAEIEENLQKLEQPIPPELWEDLKREGLLEETTPAPLLNQS
jgi:D-threo-aldose 1-dehydrogenase